MVVPKKSDFYLSSHNGGISHLKRAENSRVCHKSRARESETFWSQNDVIVLKNLLAQYFYTPPHSKVAHLLRIKKLFFPGKCSSFAQKKQSTKIFHGKRYESMSGSFLKFLKYFQLSS
jgi:hypothetical protein